MVFNIYFVDGSITIISAESKEAARKLSKEEFIIIDFVIIEANRLIKEVDLKSEILILNIGGLTYQYLHKERNIVREVISKIPSAELWKIENGKMKLLEKNGAKHSYVRLKNNIKMTQLKSIRNPSNN